MFCQVRGKRDDVELQDVQELPKFEDIMKKGKLIPEDLIAAEGKYHPKCLVKFVWAKYQEMAGTYETEIPQMYVSRRQSFIEDIQARLGHKANFVRSLDVQAPLYMYPGDQSDYVISKTLTKASRRELFDSSEDSSEEDTVLIKAQTTSLFQEMILVGIKIRADLKDTRGHSDLWSGLDQDQDLVCWLFWV